MKKLKLDIVTLTYSQTQPGTYALVLAESKGSRRLPIVIGSHEAQAIAIEIEKMVPSRPLTHDLFKSFAQSFKIRLEEILIYNLVDGVFYAKLICTDGTSVHEIDARTSDAIALAVRFDAPIYTYEFIMSVAGISVDINDTLFFEDLSMLGKNDLSEEFASPTPQNAQYKSMSLVDLQVLLDEFLTAEAYEKAAAIRDEIALRKNAD